MSNFRIKKSNNIYINLFSIFILFFMFIILSLILIIFAADSYKKMRNQVEGTFNSTAIVGYVSNKIKSFDENECAIQIKKSNNKYSMLGLESKKEKLITYVYIKDNYICENVVQKGSKMDENSGQRLFQAKNLEYEKINDKLLYIKIRTLDNELLTRYVSVTSKVSVSK